MLCKVSVVVPVYNSEAFLRECLYSITNQSHQNIEIIVVNDGSRDDSLAIIEEFVRTDARIRIFSQPNSGISEARNAGIRYATGEYIAFVDSDDWISEDLLSRLLERSDQHDLVVCSYFREFRNMRLPRRFNISGSMSSHDFKSLLICPLVDGFLDPGSVDSLTTVWGKLYKTAVIKANGIAFVSLQEVGTGEDLLFNLSYVDKAGDVFVIDEPLYHYRKYNANSITTRYKSDLKVKWQSLYVRIGELVGQNPHHQTLFHYRRAVSTIGLSLNEMNNSAGFMAIYQALSHLVSSESYARSYRLLPLSRLKIPWKVFFFLARYKLTLSMLLMLQVMKAIINRGN